LILLFALFTSFWSLQAFQKTPPGKAAVQSSPQRPSPPQTTPTQPQTGANPGSVGTGNSQGGQQKGNQGASQDSNEPLGLVRKYGALIPFLVALIPLSGSIWVFFKTRAVGAQIADRTVRIEAQKLLLEINKQYVSNPALLGIYDENFEQLSFEERNSSKLKLSLRAMAYMKMNVFEIVFAVHPTGNERTAWLKYFKDSLDKCSMLREVICRYKYLYSDGLINAYLEVTQDFPQSKRCAALNLDEVGPPLSASSSRSSWWRFRLRRADFTPGSGPRGKGGS
jgi:hypothetical protein